MKTGLFFGSFNPVHNGHIAMANYFIEQTDIDQLWFVISPHNPLKNIKTLLPGHLRLKMLELAIEDDSRYKICDIEFHLPQPSYTIETLTFLSEKYPANKFVMFMGSDGLVDFNKWKNFEQIIKKYTRYIYPRTIDPDFDISIHKNSIFLKEAPVIDISSSKIRQALKEGKDVSQYLPVKVFHFIKKNFSDDNFKE